MERKLAMDMEHEQKISLSWSVANLSFQQLMATIQLVLNRQ